MLETCSKRIQLRVCVLENFPTVSSYSFVAYFNACIECGVVPNNIIASLKRHNMDVSHAITWISMLSKRIRSLINQVSNNFGCKMPTFIAYAFDYYLCTSLCAV